MLTPGGCLAQAARHGSAQVHSLRSKECQGSTPLLHRANVESFDETGRTQHRPCSHTASGRPWLVDVVVEFIDERRAVVFERYLKSGSGVAFAKRRLR